ncbi:MAG: hypothetical protein ACLSTV_01215 [Coriobacteriales bacterium]|jgi:DNA mismatch repair protein mutS
MPNLNLTAETPEQETLLKHLKPLLSDVLTEKINNGVKIEKDGQTLINKKDLSTFLDYATDQTMKQIAEKDRKGKVGICVDGDQILNWAIHYFEEDSIEGKLLTEDGTEYKPAKPVTKQSQRNPAPAVTPAPTNAKQESKPQLSFFDMLSAEKPEPTNTSVPATVPAPTPQKQPIPAPIPLQASPLYQRYLSLQQKHPDSVVLWRLGDFYEVFGDNAVKISELLDLTLMGRDFGLPERIPMIGFPYHAAEIYFSKLTEKGFTLAVAENLDSVRLLPEKEIDGETGEILSEEEMQEFDGDLIEPNEADELSKERERMKVFDKDSLCVILELFDAKITLA